MSESKKERWREVSLLLDAVLSVDPSERTGWLEREIDDADLRFEVAELLANAERHRDHIGDGHSKRLPDTIAVNSVREELMSRLSLFGLVFICTTGAALAGGPVFTDNVTSQTTNPDFILDDTDGEVWALEADEPVARAFAISHDGGAVHSLVIEDGAPENSLYIDDSGRVGINTGAPSADLEVYGGFSGSEVRLTSFNGDWYIFGGADLFEIGFGTGVDGTRLLIDRNNNGVTISGSLIQVSSRTTKADIRPVEVDGVLGRVLELPIAEWRYLNEKEGVRHMGPMAEDFRAAFGLGTDGEGIALLDATGVALAAVQGLEADQRAKIDKLTAELTTLRAELTELAATVASSRCASEADEAIVIADRSGPAGVSR